MKLASILITGALLTQAVRAHRLDEYLQATLISISMDRIDLEMNLTPGVNVAPTVLALVDTDHDGQISEAEGRSYARSLLKEIALKLDDQRLSIRLVKSSFPSIEDVKDGLGSIHLEFTSKASPGSSAFHSLSFQNRSHPEMSVYLVNALMPTNGIQILNQKRDELQRGIRLEFKAPSGLLVSGSGVPAKAQSNGDAFKWWLVLGGLGGLALLDYRRHRHNRPVETTSMASNKCREVAEQGSSNS